MSGAKALCACGCGLPAPGTYNPKTGEPTRYAWGHANRRIPPFPLNEEVRATIIQEITANAGIGEYYREEKVRNLLNSTVRALAASPTLRRTIAEAERG